MTSTPGAPALPYPPAGQLSMIISTDSYTAAAADALAAKWEARRLVALSTAVLLDKLGVRCLAGFSPLA